MHSTSIWRACMRRREALDVTETLACLWLSQAAAWRGEDEGWAMAEDAARAQDREAAAATAAADADASLALKLARLRPQPSALVAAALVAAEGWPAAGGLAAAATDEEPRWQVVLDNARWLWQRHKSKTRRDVSERADQARLAVLFPGADLRGEGVQEWKLGPKSVPPSSP